MPAVIPDIARAWRYPSVNVPVLVLAIEATLTADPHLLDGLLPQRLVHAVKVVLLVWAAYDRLVTHPAPAPVNTP